MLRYGGCLLAILAVLTGQLPELDAQSLAPIPITKLSGAQQPRLARHASGRIDCVFGKEESIFCCHWNEGDATFSDPILVGTVEKLALGRRRGPRIQWSGDHLVITAISHMTGQLMAWRSSDRGATWSSPVTVNNPADSAKEGLHAMAASPDGKLGCVWLDHRNGRTELYGAFSDDHGSQWETNQRIYRSPEGNICECCHPSVAFGPDGTCHVVWRNSLKGNRDMYHIARSSSEPWDTATQLGGGHWQLAQCPMDGGDLAVDSEGRCASVWRRGGLVYLTVDEEKENLLGRGEQPVVTAIDQQLVIAWLTRRGGELKWQWIGSGQPPQTLADKANDPVLLSGKDDVWIAWESQAEETGLWMARLPSVPIHP